MNIVVLTAGLVIPIMILVVLEVAVLLDDLYKIVSFRYATQTGRECRSIVYFRDKRND